MSNYVELFTWSERHEKKYTVYRAFDLASWRLKGKPVCIDALKNRHMAESITLYEVNRLADEMVADTNMWG